MMLPADNLVSLSGRDQLGRFLPGTGGRPKGAKGKASRQTLEQVKAMGGDATQALWEALQAREKWAVEFVLSKILPVGRTVEWEGTSPTDVQAGLEAGDISPSEGKDLATALAKLKEIEDLDAIKAKLTELEKVVGNGARR